MRAHFVVGLVVVAALITAAPAGAATLGGQWHLDESNYTGMNHTTPDSSGNNVTLTSSDQIPLVAGRFGLATQITNRDETPTSYADEATIQPQQLTLLAWVKRSGDPGAGKYIAALGSDVPCNHASYGLYANAGLKFSIWNGSTVHTSATASNAVWDGNWHMVAGTYDGAAVRLFVDGAQVGSAVPATGAIDYSQFSDLFSIGDYPYGLCGDRRFPGNVDEVRVYNGALTAPELSALPWPAPPSSSPPPPPEEPTGSPPPPASGSGGRSCPAGTSAGVSCQPSGGGIRVTGTSGNDTIVAPADAKVVNGGAGNDKIDCKASRAACHGGAGQDTLTCRSSQARCDGGAGNDKLDCKATKGVCQGGSGQDKLDCASARSKSRCDGGTGNDKLNCKETNGRCEGGSGQDKLGCAGAQAKSSCAGGAGNDKLDCKATKGACAGGSGNDRLDCRDSKAKVKCDGGAGKDQVLARPAG